MASVPREGTYDGPGFASATPVRAKDQGRTEGRMYKKGVMEYWPEWLFTAVVLLGGILMLVMLLKT